jgi:hypothetical protein
MKEPSVGAYTSPVLDEPDISSSKPPYVRVLEPLALEHPGSWGVIGQYKSESSAYQAALNLRGGKYRIFGSPEEWEFLADGDLVYARYKA